MASKKNSKGKRYTEKEKQKILNFVEAHNAEKGRGGAAAASRKFKVSQLTIGAWLKKSKGGAKAKAPAAGRSAAKRGKAAAGRAKAAPGGGSGRSKVLSQLNAVDRQIAAKRKELAALEAKFDKLVASL